MNILLRKIQINQKLSSLSLPSPSPSPSSNSYPEPSSSPSPKLSSSSSLSSLGSNKKQIKINTKFNNTITIIL